LVHLLFAEVQLGHVKIVRTTHDPDILSTPIASEPVRVVVMELQTTPLGTSSTLHALERTWPLVSLPHETFNRGGDPSYTWRSVGLVDRLSRILDFA